MICSFHLASLLAFTPAPSTSAMVLRSWTGLLVLYVTFWSNQHEVVNRGAHRSHKHKKNTFYFLIWHVLRAHVHTHTHVWPHSHTLHHNVPLFFTISAQDVCCCTCMKLATTVLVDFPDLFSISVSSLITWPGLYPRRSLEAFSTMVPFFTSM